MPMSNRKGRPRRRATVEQIRTQQQSVASVTPQELLGMILAAEVANPDALFLVEVDDDDPRRLFLSILTDPRED